MAGPIFCPVTEQLFEDQLSPLLTAFPPSTATLSTHPSPHEQRIVPGNTTWTRSDRIMSIPVQQTP
jgi:hypothetical protein